MRVACYVRVSSERQAEKELSIPGQLTALRGYAAKSGHAVVRESVDEAETGRSSNRPAFKEMIALARLKHPPFEAILVWKLSRFARNREDSIVYKSLLRKRGIQLISINEPIEDTPSGRLLEGVIEVIDEFYSANLAQDVERGMRDNAAKGFFCGGVVPYGYKPLSVQDGQAVRKKLQPDEATAPVVERIFRECLQGKGTKEIARSLNKFAIPGPTGKPWSRTGVHYVLTNEAVVGTLIWGRKRKGKEPIRAENAWPPIVEKDTFVKAQAILHSRSPKATHPRSLTSDYLLGGIIRCAECGSPMTGLQAKSGGYSYYRCAKALRGGPEACPGRWLPKHKIEQFIINRIRDNILTDDNLSELIRLTNEEIEGLVWDEKERTKLLDGRIRDVVDRLERLYDALETGRFAADELAPRIRALDVRKSELQEAQEEAMNVSAVAKVRINDIDVIRAYVEDLKTLLGSAPIM
jgi:site-specific DNA recombinase